MIVSPTELPEVLLIEPKRHGDARGWFSELHNDNRYGDAGISGPWTQDNIAHSAKGTVRGLHLQEPNPQGKLITALQGSIIDVAVDVRLGSPRYGQHVAVSLSAENGAQLWVPPGFAHGYQALEDNTLVLYKCSVSFWSPTDERTVNPFDPALAIAWPIELGPVNDKDREAPVLADMSNELPHYSV